MSSFVLRVTTKAQFLIITAIGVSLGADNSLDPASKKDLDGLQGTWKLVSAMRDGEALPKDKVKQTTIVIKDDTFVFPDLAEYATSKEGTFTRVLLAGAAVLITTDGGLSANPRSLSGRNEPRPCGSGKKYKNCCGRVA